MLRFIDHPIAVPAPVAAVIHPIDSRTAIRPMLTSLLKSKIHRATVTAASVDYEGSLTIAADLAERVGLRAYERILVGNLANGERFETYVIYGAEGSGAIELNGATAHLGKPGDKLTIMSFAWLDDAEAKRHVPSVIVLDDRNRVLK
jgi:aspartate 1-decarboxylase